MSVANNIVVDILERRSEWLDTKALLTEVIKERKVSERQAYRYILGALKRDIIRKVEFPDRLFLYGLPDWGFPITSEKKKEALSFQDAFKYRGFKRLEEISDLWAKGHHGDGQLLAIAYRKIKALVQTFPPERNEALKQKVKEADSAITILAKSDVFVTNLARERELVRLTDILVEWLIGEVSKVLHES